MNEQIAALVAELRATPGLSAGKPLIGLSDQPTKANALASYIDHTLLKAEATPAQIRELCAEAKQYGFASVCVNAGYVALAAECLAGSAVKVCTVIGFPLGATTTATKVFEAREAAAAGASELDMVLAVGRLKAGEYAAVSADIAAVAAECHAAGAWCKVIIETALLNDEEKIAACWLAQHAGADFVKTSTGFLGGGATVADIALMRETVGPAIGVKASGGVRSRSDAEAMIAAGASRLGASAGVTIVNDGKTTGEGY